MYAKDVASLYGHGQSFQFDVIVLEAVVHVRYRC